VTCRLESTLHTRSEIQRNLIKGPSIRGLCRDKVSTSGPYYGACCGTMSYVSSQLGCVQRVSETPSCLPIAPSHASVRSNAHRYAMPALKPTCLEWHNTCLSLAIARLAPSARTYPRLIIPEFPRLDALSRRDTFVTRFVTGWTSSAPLHALWIGVC
jgi:hypothetical protein